MRHLQTLHKKHCDKGLVILGLNTADDRQIGLDILRRNSVTFPNILDASDAGMKTTFRGYRGTAVPLNYVIDRKGNVAAAWYANYRRAIDEIAKLGIK